MKELQSLNWEKCQCEVWYSYNEGSQNTVYKIDRKMNNKNDNVR